jgi:hypothetical protein
MGSDDILSIGVAASEAGVGVAKMSQTLRGLGVSPVVLVNHIPHYRTQDVEEAISHLHANRTINTQAGRAN